jgi:hypothetical protein
MIVIHDKILVDMFTFIQSELKAESLIDHVATFETAVGREQAWSTAFSEGLAFTLFGAYSIMHDKALYQDGYNCEEARHLHWM